MNTAYPCPHCGSFKDTWFSRTEPMGFICPDCGRDVDDQRWVPNPAYEAATHELIGGHWYLREREETPAEPLSVISEEQENALVERLIREGTLVDAGKSGGSIPDQVCASPDKSKVCVTGYKCPHCGREILEWVDAHEPWDGGHWACGKCDSTYSTLPTIAEKPKSSPMMGVQEMCSVLGGFHAPVNCPEIVKLVKELLSILNETEESDSGTVFHPTTISSCRTMNVVRLREIFGDLERMVK